jgi:hypothetical protein
VNWRGYGKNQSKSRITLLSFGLPPISSFWRHAPWDSRPVIVFSNSTLAVIIFMCHRLWREDESVAENCCWSSPAQSYSGSSPAGLMTTFYSLTFGTRTKAIVALSRHLDRWTEENHEKSVRIADLQAPQGSVHSVKVSDGDCCVRGNGSVTTLQLRNTRIVFCSSFFARRCCSTWILPWVTHVYIRFRVILLHVIGFITLE